MRRLARHRLGRAHAQQPQGVAQHLARGGQQRQARARQGQVVDEEALGSVVGMERGRQVAQVEGHIVRRQVGGGARQHLGVFGQLQHQRLLGGGDQQRQVRRVQPVLPLRQHRADAGVRVLHVEHRVLVVGLQRQVDVEDELGVGLAADQEEAHRVAAGHLDQVAQRIDTLLHAGLRVAPAKQRLRAGLLWRPKF